MRDLKLNLLAAAFLFIPSVIFAAANTITFSVKSPAGINAFIGNMVSPENGSFWAKLPSQSTWTWENNGKNVNSFALMINFKGDLAGNPGPHTAIGAVVVNPQNLDGDVNVTINLKSCHIDGDKNNPQYKVATGGAGSVKFFSSQPSCD